jgi:organic radical activating enzyme
MFTYLMTLLQQQSTNAEVISWTGGNPPYILSVLLVI